MSKHDSILSDNQIKQIDEKYAELSDNDIIERLAYLEIVNDEKHIIISDIEPTKELISLSSQIFDIQKDFQKIKTMFELFVSDVADFLSIKVKLESKKLSIDEVSINRFMIHLLSSGKLFVDFNENQIKQKYSKNSEELKQIHSFASHQYETNFAYRFCYSLRNFSQHIDVPIQKIKVVSPDDETIVVKFYIDLDYLLNSSFDWKKLKNELLALRSETSKIDAIMLTEDYLQSIVELYDDYCKLFLELNHNKLVGIKSKLENLNLKHDKYYISKISKYDLKYNPSNHTFSPIAAFAEIEEIYIELSKIGLVNIIQK
ncbi:ribosome-binding factor A [Streptococcus ruminantium]|uniref:ribosome-binding factor A n=1 Tax=Streptococcus ruminantium TaxID=1917441 RepID=UPI001D13E0F9|nr:ribosome-binding factor A [Streptococcus ruminantium]